MKRLLFSAALAAAIITPAIGDEEKAPLFNGTDFTGWKIVSDPKKQPSPQALFTVSDGAIHTYCHETPGWNHVDLTVDGDHAVFRVNGHIVNEAIDMKQRDADTKSWKPLT